MLTFGRARAYPLKKDIAPDMYGITTIHIHGNFDADIILVGREVYQTDDEMEIEMLSRDQEIVQLKNTKKGGYRVED